MTTKCLARGSAKQTVMLAAPAASDFPVWRGAWIGNNLLSSFWSSLGKSGAAEQLPKTGSTLRSTAPWHHEM